MLLSKEKTQYKEHMMVLLNRSSIDEMKTLGKFRGIGSRSSSPARFDYPDGCEILMLT